MPHLTVNGVRLYYTVSGESGEPLVLVHGSWADHSDWDLVVPLLAQRFRVVAYDRRGHSQSESSPGPGNLDEDAADLAAVIEQLDLGPAHVVGLSLGGSITLRLAATRPDLFRTISVQEPPLFGLLVDNAEHGPVMRQVVTDIEAVVQRLAGGDAEGGARLFIETVALGPGAWEMLPPDVRRLLVHNAAAFLDEARDPGAITLDVDALANIRVPVLLTRGDQSPAGFAPVVTLLATLLPDATTKVFRGAGHLPMVTQPAEYAEALTAFAASARAQSLV
jgi:pimeloyl-ACP methyl ester carboxylesterase